MRVVFVDDPVLQRLPPVLTKNHPTVSIVPGIINNNKIVIPHRQARDIDLLQGLIIFKGHVWTLKKCSRYTYVF